MIWDAILEEDIKAYVKYRWGIISVKLVTERAGIFQEAEISEQINDEYDGVLDIEEAIEWLEKNGYEVVNLIEQ